jgi:hypothetical protein
MGCHDLQQLFASGKSIVSKTFIRNICNNSKGIELHTVLKIFYCSCWLCEWQGRVFISVASGQSRGTSRHLFLYVSAGFGARGRLLMTWKIVILIINGYFLF